MKPSNLGTILGIWAHPDDETYLSAAIMAEAAAQGSRVYCVTATRGEAGSQDATRWPPEKLADIRSQELLEALALLGVTEHQWLDYPDGGCASVPATEAVDRLEAVIKDVDPDTVLTFGPDGQTGHPDHIAVYRWTTEAFKRAASPEAELLYATVTPEWADRFVPLLEPYNVFGPGTPEITDVADLAVHVIVEGELLDTKLKALSAQVSQTEGLINAFGRDAYLEAISEESFRRS